MHRIPLAERFWAKVERRSESECWLWAGAIDTTGYGVLNSGGRGRKLYAHRVSAAIAYGEAPIGADVMHHCDVRACVNPRHLSFASRGTNMQDAKAKGRLRRPRRTHCAKGHAYTPANTRISYRGSQVCLACGRDWMRAKRASLRN